MLELLLLKTQNNCKITQTCSSTKLNMYQIEIYFIHWLNYSFVPIILSMRNVLQIEVLLEISFLNYVTTNNLK